MPDTHTCSKSASAGRELAVAAGQVAVVVACSTLRISAGRSPRGAEAFSISSILSALAPRFGP